MSLSTRVLAAAMLVSVIGAGRAEAYLVTDSSANQGGVSFLADAGATGFNAGSAITAQFNYNGPLAFNDTAAQNSDSTGDLNGNFFNGSLISGYTRLSTGQTIGSPANANFASLTTFLASSGSASNYEYGSYMTIDLGVLAAGTILTITHDDGASVYQDGTMIGSMTDGPTTAVTESVTLSATTDTMLYYARENGTPSVLDVSVPEPASMAIVGFGLTAVGVVRRRRATRMS